MKRQDIESPQGRVAVVRGRHLVPLLVSQEATPTRLQPWNGVVLEQHRVAPGEILEHEHPTLCLHLQLAGTQSFEWWERGKNAVEPTRPGSLIVIPPGTRDRLRWQGHSERLVLSIENEPLEKLASQLGAQHPLEIKSAWSLFDSSLQHLMTEMGRETREGWPLGALYADLLALGLQTSLLRNHSNQQISPPFKGRLSLSLLKRAMEYITANLAEDIGLGQIARELGLSESHFAHEFRTSTGATPYQYLLQQRMEKAKALLRTTKLPIQNVSVLAGFRYPANFVRTFRQREGQSPDAWRRGQSGHYSMKIR
ncbi:helix-turn-helix domain-containing protein [Granulicella sp. 5B5]|uniref:AraC family transcriptional regulator n=1 Tax=Granulicella sp. 5B5 TaxID=1617967 RepID=UPI0015F54762|nr:AraC family transcriptional regulator [Granulicella sp. 5B5]QMV19176.1 helix-turn-helix domain-containing protein [Granulicella sp. 5B5]